MHVAFLAESSSSSHRWATTALLLVLILTTATLLVLVVSRVAAPRPAGGRVNVWRLSWRTLVALAVDWALTAVVLYVPGLPGVVVVVLLVVSFLVYFSGLLMDLGARPGMKRR